MEENKHGDRRCIFFTFGHPSISYKLKRIWQTCENSRKSHHYLCAYRHIEFARSLHKLELMDYVVVNSINRSFV